MAQIALERDEDADVTEIEESSLETVTEKRAGGRNLLPFFFFGGLGVVGLAFVVMGMKPKPEPRTLVPATSAVEFSTGYQGTDTIPAFQRELSDPAPTAQPQRQRVAPPADTSSGRADAMLLRARLERENAQMKQRLQSQSARDAFELQQDQRVFEQTVEAERVLRKRQAATALIFDDSKDQE